MSQNAPQNAPTPSEPDRWNLLELDLPPATEPELPRWAALAIAAIAAVLPIPPDAAFAALEALVAPLRTQPDGAAKDAVRAALATKQAEIRAARGVQPATQRAIPVVQPTEQTVPVQTPALRPRAIIGQWRKQDGDWCVLLPMFLGTRAPRVGDVVCAERRNGTRENKRVTSLVWSRADGVLVAVEATDEAVTYFQGETTQAPGSAPVATVGSAGSAPVNSELAAEDLGLAQELAAAQGESQANAATQASGSLHEGTMRGVGFSTAVGYVQALANGVKAATAESYKSTLRTSYGYTTEQIAALTVTIIPEASELPVGTGITHEPTGPSIFDMPKAQRSFRVGSQPSTPTARATIRETQAAARKVIVQGNMIAGLMHERALLQWSWKGGGERKRDAFVTAFEAANIPTDWVPPAPSAERSCGHAVETLKGREYDTKRLPGTDLPDGVKARWQVGRALTGTDVTAGAAYGTILLVVDLHADGSLSFDGDAGLAASVRSRYNAITSGEILKSDVLTAWLGRLLASRFYAVQDGGIWYVPAGERDNALALYDVIRAVGWGSHRAIRVTDERDVASVLSDGLRAAMARVAGEVIEAIEECRERARAKAVEKKLDPELAARRASLTTTKAASLIKEVATMASRISGYEAAMGEGSARELRQMLIATQRALESVAGDDATARAAMLELE